jgi:tritrans,polycis-undecaprenyl-diphosphate synthase [geranylgeranyl-diphosphate specific]
MANDKSEITRVISKAAYKTYEKRLTAEIKKFDPPKHIAVIMDGNRRFAEELSLKSIEGHIRGRGKLEEVLEWCMETGVKVLTVYAFSTENFNREEDEIKTLMEVFAKSFRDVITEERIHKHKIKITAIGQRDLLPKNVQDAIAYAEDKTKDYDKHHLNIAIAYGGREEIITAIKSIAKDVQDKKLKVKDIDQKKVASYLYTSDLPDPDLVLRTSGEERISNFLLWQLAYSELYFIDVYWPGFRKIDFLRAVRTYQLRKRRFGK